MTPCKLQFIALAALASMAGAAAFVVPQPRPVDFVDGESTAFFGISLDVPGTLSATVSFDASPSNCVELAFGRDLDFDGELDWSEAAVKVGWDAGEWLASSPVTGETFAADPASPNQRKTLSLIIRIDADGEATLLSLRENGVPILAEATPALVGAGRIDLWNCVRETVRGAPFAAQASVTTRRDGSMFSVR